jgi:hypothetical protein
MDDILYLLSPWKAFATKILAFLPNLFAAIIVASLGWIVAKFAKSITSRLLEVIHFENAIEKAGIKKILDKGDIIETPSELLSLFIYWIVILIFLLSSLNILGLSVVTDLINKILLYIPNLIAGILILILGLFFANIIAGIIKTTCLNAGIKEGEILGDISKYGVIIFFVAISLEEIGLASNILLAGFVIIFGAICLALALSFGLGGKEVAGEYIKKWTSERAKNKNKE